MQLSKDNHSDLKIHASKKYRRWFNDENIVMDQKWKETLKDREREKNYFLFCSYHTSHNLFTQLCSYHNKYNVSHFVLKALKNKCPLCINIK